MSFEEIIYLMETAEDYTDLYDAAENIVDDELRNNVINAIGVCEDDGDTVEEAYSIITSDWLDTHNYELNESVDIEDDETKSLDTYLSSIKEVSNDKDLVNILDEMEEDKNIDSELVANIRQLFRNNRFMPLSNKIDAIMRFLDTAGVKEIKTESLSNDEKENKSIDEIKEDDEDDDKLKVITDRIGQQMSVGSFNKFLQTTFNQFNKLFLLESDLYSMDLSTNQQIQVEDDEQLYTIYYDIVDVDGGIIEMTDVDLS